ncbi:MAG: chromate transporter, partial [Terrimicrobiaceae bacterium]|nr:chromate transporter [Terrimicrobiaceae bacterium]
YGWLTDRQFADVFALSQAAPGPSILIVTMIGYEAGARAGGPVLGVGLAVLATMCMILPAGMLVFLVGRVWDSLRDSPARHAIEAGLAPLAVGLVLASGWVMLGASDHGPAAWGLTAVCTVIFTFTRWSPLLVVGVAALAGYLGWV